MLSAKEIAIDRMLKNDAFSIWLGINVLEIKKGYCIAEMTVRDEMTNGFKIAHGGITYSFADSAFAFASNSQGKHAVSLETSISHLKKVESGDILTAVAKEINLTQKTGLYQIEIHNQYQELVAQFKGIVYRKSQDWI